MLAIFQFMLGIFQFMLAIFQLMLAIFQLMLAIFQLMTAIFQFMLGIFQFMLGIFQFMFAVRVDVGQATRKTARRQPGQFREKIHDSWKSSYHCTSTIQPQALIAQQILAFCFNPSLVSKLHINTMTSA